MDPYNEATLLLLRSRAGELSGCWELDIFVLPIPIGDTSGRPYFPICFLVVDREHGFIVDSNLTEPWLSLAEKRNEVIKTLEKATPLPQEVRVRSNKVMRIIKPITTILGIKLRVSSLPMLEQAKRSLYGRLRRRRR